MLRQIILDTETTGLDVRAGHRVIEIGCIELINRRFTGKEFHTYLNPDREIDEGAEKVHGLSRQFLRDKPRFEKIFEEFKLFIQSSELLIHNADFDIGFLDNEINLLPENHSSIKDIVEKVTDTLQLARKKHPGQRNSLDALVQRYEVDGYDRKLHGALVDSKILGDVYLLMTGGQSDLVFQGSEASQVAHVTNDEKKSSSINVKKILEVKLNEEEEQAQLNYLKKMEEETGKKPIWLIKKKTNGNS